jgi:hypothetical protein
MTDRHKAVYVLYPNVVSFDDAKGAFDAQGNHVEVDVAALDAWVDPQAYQYQRQQAYESIEEQLDMLYWDKVNGTNNWETMITTVKNLYPKPTE